MVLSERSSTLPVTASTYSLRTDFDALVHLRVALLVEYNLGYARAVAQVDEDEIAVIAPPVDPAHQSDRAAGIGRAQLAAAVRPLQIA